MVVSFSFLLKTVILVNRSLLLKDAWDYLIYQRLFECALPLNPPASTILKSTLMPLKMTGPFLHNHT